MIRYVAQVLILVVHPVSLRLEDLQHLAENRPKVPARAVPRQGDRNEEDVCLRGVADDVVATHASGRDQRDYKFVH